MIIEYDDRFNLTPDQKLRSLKENIQLALNEVGNNSERLYRSLLKSLGVEVDSLRTDFTSLSERLESEAQALSEAVAGALSRLESVEAIAAQVGPALDDITSMKNRLTTLENNYTALAGRVGTLETNYTALEARVRALENA